MYHYLSPPALSGKRAFFSGLRVHYRTCRFCYTEGMTDNMPTGNASKENTLASDLIPGGYSAFLTELKERIRTAQVKAALSVNREMVLPYWQIGRDILLREGWGAKVIECLSRDLRAAFPEMKGFLRTNLLYMRAFAHAWPEEPFVQQLVGQIPWGQRSHSGQDQGSCRAGTVPIYFLGERLCSYRFCSYKPGRTWLPQTWPFPRAMIWQGLPT